DRLEQLLLAGEIDVEGPLRDARRLRDLAHAGAVKPLRQEDLTAAIHDLPTLGRILFREDIGRLQRHLARHQYLLRASSIPHLYIWNSSSFFTMTEPFSQLDSLLNHPYNRH